MTVLRQDQLVELAVGIGERLLKDAHCLGDGSLTWGRGYGLNMEPVPDSGMFNGRIGEAVFLSALAVASSRADFEAAALASTGCLRASLGDATLARELASRIGLGLSGMGSIIYAFVLMASLLRRPELLISAERGAETVSKERIAADTKCDVFWGAAGALFGLLALLDRGVEAVRQRAIWCADHLLARRTADWRTGLRGWAQDGGRPVTGFAHGSSGVASALLRLHERMGDSRLYRAAVEAFDFERTVYSPAVSDWPDHPDQARKTIMSSWCHGAPGIGFSRLSILPSMEAKDESDIAGDLCLALRKVASDKLRPADNLCCGNFGRIDFLLEAAQRLQNPSLKAAAFRVAERCIERHRKQPFTIPQPSASVGPHCGPGLWQGIAGIGYSLIRLSAPAQFPCILVFQL